MNRKCPDFSGRSTCDYFIYNGSCSRQNRFMCHIFIDTDKQPINDDVDLHVGAVLEAIPPAKVVKEINPTARGNTKRMEELFGKV